MHHMTEQEIAQKKEIKRIERTQAYVESALAGLCANEIVGKKLLTALENEIWKKSILKGAFDMGQEMARKEEATYGRCAPGTSGHEYCTIDACLLWLNT